MKQTAGTSDNNTFFISQLTSLVIGGLGWFVASKIDYHFWQKYAGLLFLASVVLMFLVLIPGIAVNSGGATRWVKIGFINFQPVEFFKLGTVIFMAAWLTKNKKNLSKVFEGLIPFMIIIAVIAIPAIILQKDMADVRAADILGTLPPRHIDLLAVHGDGRINGIFQGATDA